MQTAKIDNIEQATKNKILESQNEISDELRKLERSVTALQIAHKDCQADIDLMSGVLDSTKRKVSEDVLTTLVKLEKSKCDKSE